MVSLILSIVFLPVLPLIALVIKLDSRGPICFGQERVGTTRQDFHSVEIPIDAC